MNNYPNCKLSFRDIGNIHVMRDSLNKLREGENLKNQDFVLRITIACLLSEVDGDDFKWLSNVESSQWLNHLGRILSAAIHIADAVHDKKTSILVHCSDGWDRTSQLVIKVQIFYILILP